MSEVTMRSLLASFSVATEVPGGIDALRRLIVDRAVHGLLISPIGSNSTSFELAQAMATKKAKVELGLSRKARSTPSHALTSTFECPRSWHKALLGDLCLILMGNSPPGDSYREIEEGLPLINGPTEFSRKPLGLTRRSKFTISPTSICNAGDLLVCVRGATTGRTNIAAFDACIGRGVALVRAWESQPFINLFMWHVGTKLLAAGKGTTFPSVNFNDLAQLEFGLPPLEDQSRIVARVDELMALCDQLEEAQAKRDSIRTAARKSAIDAVATASTSQELEVAWNRISSNWDVMADTAESVEDVRQMILAVAMQGHLSADSETWRHVPLGDVAKIRTGKLDANASSIDGEYPFFTCAKNPLRISTYSYDTECVLLAGNGNFDVNYYSGKFDAYQRTYIIEPKDQNAIHVPFIFRYMQRHSKELLKQSIGGVIKYIKIGFLTNAPFPLPSFAEQERIVAKVDELMALCDQLEEQLESRNAIAKKFARSVTVSESL